MSGEQEVSSSPLTELGRPQGYKDSPLSCQLRLLLPHLLMGGEGGREGGMDEGREGWADFPLDRRCTSYMYMYLRLQRSYFMASGWPQHVHVWTHVLLMCAPQVLCLVPLCPSLPPSLLP